MQKKIVGLLAASAIGVGGLAIADPAWAACGLAATAPNSNINGSGVRSGCSGTVTLTVRVRKDRPFMPDLTVGSNSATVGNATIWANGSCQGSGSYFTEVQSSSGNQLQSGRVGRC